MAAVRVLEAVSCPPNIAKKMNVDNLVFDIASAMRPCAIVRQSCCVVLNIIRVSYETLLTGNSCYRADVNQA